ncbi:alpha/beta fold hydrolase [Ruania halotolerans]|uniref:alpha/beta fold hydrolase n=1 Tax=Ruania halotolerans TaxID=2897773 RepID=UPI001E39C6CE|nr:alpha/beta fold hydrolase [Ruania halotolerans]UFU06468.1 alpha/beta fold hydrolase [Ruania halotolerans]
MYPRTTAHDHGLFTATDGQSVYWEESGNPHGVPALYLHGGPGGGLGSRGYVTKFDPERYRIIGLDQRGCGRSAPLAHEAAHDLEANTTPRLIADLDELREHLGIEAWVVNGVSWGSTLAIAYAQAHPGRVRGIVLFAVTTTSRAEVDWITEGVGMIFPEEWDRFAAHAEQAEATYRRREGRLVEAYARLLRDPITRDAASLAWARWEDVHVSVGTGGFRRDPRWEDEGFRHAFTVLASHYWAHDGFAEPPLLDRMDRIGHIPAVLIHGRRDISGPVRTAWELHRRWPASRLVIDEGDGHGGAGMVEEWVRANDEFGSLARF